MSLRDKFRIKELTSFGQQALRKDEKGIVVKRKDGKEVKPKDVSVEDRILSKTPKLGKLKKKNPIIIPDEKQESYSGEVSDYVERLKYNEEELKKALDVDVVLESTGRFLKKEQALQHVIAGAKKVVISAPSPDAKTIVLGVNNEVITEEDFVFSNASCTTNCLAPMAKVINDNFGIKSGYITTTHAFTADQSLQDMPHKDLRRARSAMNSIIPTKTGAASAVGKVLPSLNGKLDGIALRVPVACGSITDFVCIVNKETSIEEVNKLFKQAADGSMKHILSYIEDPIVSVDVIGNSYSCVFDSKLTSVLGKMVKVVGWYDNEVGYSSRLIDLIEKIS